MNMKNMVQVAVGRQAMGLMIALSNWVAKFNPRIHSLIKGSD
jgi:hypothetical protein